MSEYEEKQVKNVIEEVYKQFGKGLNKEECLAECWMAYVEAKTIISIFSTGFWQFVVHHMVEKVKEMRKRRNYIISIESKISLNQKVYDSGEEIGTILFPIQGDFTTGVLLWEYARKLGNIKYRIMRYLSQGEDDAYIISQLKIEEGDYYKIKSELQIDLEMYISA